jgi:hypothetical protein
MSSGVTHILFCLLIFVLGFYSGLSGRVRTVYFFSLCVVSLLSSRFTDTALVWFSNFLKYLVEALCYKPEGRRFESRGGGFF